jgi:hypothetical protein
MYLARDKYGRLGRKMGEWGMGDTSTPAAATPATPAASSTPATPTAVIETPMCAERTSNVYVNPNQIQADQDYWDSVQQTTAQAQAQNDAATQSSQAIADDVWYKQAKELDSFQNNIPENADDATLKNYLVNCVGTTESMRVASSISPNFNINRLAPGQVFQTPTQNPNADFNEFELMGNPLTRDGQYGVVTDWDRFLQGREMQNAEVQDPSAMNGNNNSILYKVPQKLSGMGSRPTRKRPVFAAHPQQQMGYMGDDGDDSEDADMAANAAAQVSAGTSVATAAPAGSSADDYNALPNAPASSSSSSSSSGINWTSVLTAGVASAGSVLTAAEKAAGIKPATTTVIAAPGAVATTGGIPTVLIFGLLGVVALGAGIFIFKKMRSGKPQATVTAKA